MEFYQQIIQNLSTDSKEKPRCIVAVMPIEAP